MNMKEARKELGDKYIQAILGKDDESYILDTASYFG